MADKQHIYRVTVEWTGNQGAGTAGYTVYDRDHIISADTKTPIAGSSDPAFRGNPSRWNPEELLLASIAACHQLWYLHLCATAGVSVISYRDQPVATMLEAADGSGRFIDVVLQPVVTIRSGDKATALRLHNEAHRHCFIANSLNFPVRCEPCISMIE